MLAVAMTAAPFGSEATTGQPMRRPSGTRACATSPLGWTVRASAPPWYQRTSSPGAPVGRRHAAPPLTG